MSLSHCNQPEGPPGICLIDSLRLLGWVRGPHPGPSIVKYSMIL